MKQRDALNSLHCNLAAHFHHAVGWQAEVAAGVIGVAGQANEQIILPDGHALVL